MLYDLGCARNGLRRFFFQEQIESCVRSAPLLTFVSFSDYTNVKLGNMSPFPRVSCRRIALLTLLIWLAGFGLSGCRLGATDAATRGQELFETCVPCHQQDGSGSPMIGAPNIAGMQGWYVEKQLEKFRDGVRGTNFSDVEGMRMRPMALTLPTEEDVKIVAQYVESLPPVRHASSLPGDPVAGAALFATCTACHGPNGAGNQDLGAPRISGTDDWYLATQLRKFKRGIRGTDARDFDGHLMRPMALTLADDDAVRNVVAYIGTLKP
jgi:cytochrome c553